MSLRRADGSLPFQWLTKDLSAKALIGLTLSVAALYWRQVNVVSVVSAKTDQRWVEQDHRDDGFDNSLQSQRAIMREKVDKATYEADRTRLSEQLQGIQLSLNTIQQVLMARK